MIFTHSFVHRTHVEVFTYYFPSSLKNWWSDHWISVLYGAEHTFRPEHVTIKVCLLMEFVGLHLYTVTIIFNTEWCM